MRTGRRPGVKVALAGERIAGQGAPEDEAQEQTRRDEEARREALRLAWLEGETDPDAVLRQSREVTSRELLTGSSFALTSETRRDGEFVTL